MYINMILNLIVMTMFLMMMMMKKKMMMMMMLMIIDMNMILVTTMMLLLMMMMMLLMMMTMMNDVNFDIPLLANFKSLQPFHDSGAEQRQGCTEKVESNTSCRIYCSEDVADLSLKLG